MVLNEIELLGIGGQRKAKDYWGQGKKDNESSRCGFLTCELAKI